MGVRASPLPGLASLQSWPDELSHPTERRGRLSRVRSASRPGSPGPPRARAAVSPATSARLRLACAALLFSTGGAGIKAAAFTGWQIASFRSGIAAAVLWLCIPGARRGWTRRTLLVGTAYACTLVLFVLANRLTTSANTIFLQSTAAQDTPATRRAGIHGYISAVNSQIIPQHQSLDGGESRNLRLGARVGEGPAGQVP